MLAPNQCDTSGEEEVPMDEDDPDDPPEMDCPAIVDADGDNLGYMDKGGTEDSDKKELTMVERMISW